MRKRYSDIICIVVPLIINIFQYISGSTNTAVFWLSCGFCAVMAVLNPIYGISSFSIFNVLSSLDDTNGKYLFVALLAGVAFNYIFAGNFKKLYFSRCWLPIVLIILTAFTRISDNSPQSPVYQLFYIEMAMVILIGNRNFGNEEKIGAFNIYKYAYISGALMYSVFSLLNMAIGTSRLRAFGTGTVRSLSNMLGIAIIFCLFGLSKQLASKFKIIYMAIIAYCFVILLMTGSRGVMYSVILVALYYVIAEKLLSPKGIVATFIVVIAAVIIVYRFVPSFLNLSRIFEADDGTRLEIWENLLNNMTANDYLVGIGLNNSYSLIGWYSHSVFVDTLVSLGIPAFSALIIWCVGELVAQFRNKNHMKVTLVLGTVLLFISHGSVFSDTFWMLVIILFYIPDEPCEPKACGENTLKCFN